MKRTTNLNISSLFMLVQALCKFYENAIILFENNFIKYIALFVYKMKKMSKKVLL